MEKHLHTQFMKNTEVEQPKTLGIGCKNELSKKRQGIIMAAQDQVLWTNNAKYRTGSMCRSDAMKEKKQ